MVTNHVQPGCGAEGTQVLKQQVQQVKGFTNPHRLRSKPQFAEICGANQADVLLFQELSSEFMC